MIYTRLLKLLEGDVDVSQLNEDNIAEYVQAKQTITAFGRFVIDPFKEHVKESTHGDVIFSGNGLKITSSVTSSPARHSDKTLLTLLGSHLQTTETNHEKGKQSYGVRLLGDDVRTVEAAHVQDIFEGFKEEITGTNYRSALNIQGAKPIAKAHMGRLATVFATGYDLGDKISFEDAALYVVAMEQVGLLKKRIITPFENAFKLAAEEQDHTTFDHSEYGGLIVQVKNVPRFEADAKAGVTMVDSALAEYVGLQESGVDNSTTFWNRNLSQPKPYVSLDTMKQLVDTAQNANELKHKKEIAVLYRPEPATILAV